MKKSRFFLWSGFGLLAVVLLGAFVFVYLNNTTPSKIVLADEAKEHSVMLHNAMGDHACDCFQPWIMNVTLSAITSNSVNVSWHSGTWQSGVDGPATYQVTWGTTTAKPNTFPTTLPTVAYVDHTVTLTGLTANTKYYIGVKGCCLSNCNRGGGPTYCKTFQQAGGVKEWTFTTIGGTGHTIKGIIGTTANGKKLAKVATPISGVLVTLSGGATQSMTTAADGVYQFTGLGVGNYTVTPTKAGITFVPASRTYTGFSADTSAQNFAQSTGVAADNQVAENAAISAVEVAKVTATDVTITWKTGIPATSMVEYGLTTDYGLKSGVNGEIVYNHDIQLFELRKGATYHARAVSYAEGNSDAPSYSPDFTFKVPSTEDRIADKRLITNEPNPASRWTMFTYFLYQPAKYVTIDVLTLSGKLVATLESPSSSLGAGWNKVRWDNMSDRFGKPLDNGLYIYRMKFHTLSNMEQQIQCSSLRIEK